VLIGNWEGDFESLLPTTTIRWVKLSSSCQLQLRMLAVKGPSVGLRFLGFSLASTRRRRRVGGLCVPRSDQQRGRGRRFSRDVMTQKNVKIEALFRIPAPSAAIVVRRFPLMAIINVLGCPSYPLPFRWEITRGSSSLFVIPTCRTGAFCMPRAEKCAGIAKGLAMWSQATLLGNASRRGGPANGLVWHGMQEGHMVAIMAYLWIDSFHVDNFFSGIALANS